MLGSELEVVTGRLKPGKLYSEYIAACDYFRSSKISLGGAIKCLGAMAVQDTSWEKHIKDGNSFVTRVLEQPKVWIYGSEHELTA